MKGRWAVISVVSAAAFGGLFALLALMAGGEWPQWSSEFIGHIGLCALLFGFVAAFAVWLNHGTEL